MSNLKKQQIATSVFDGETGEMAEVTAEGQRMASYLHQQVLLGVFISATAIKKMFDEKLYLALGCQTKEEYCLTLPYGYRQANKLYQIAAKFEDVSKNLIGEGFTGISSSGMLENMNSSSHLNEKDIASLGITKLYQLTRLEDENIKELIKEGKTELGGGEISIEEIKEMSAKEVSRTVSEATKKYKAKIAQLTEENALLSAEKKQTEKELSALKEKEIELEEIENKYGPTASKLEHKRKKLDEARALLNDFSETIIRTGISAEDPATLRRDMQDLIKKINETYEVILLQFEDVIID